jgi:hypothetical protein
MADPSGDELVVLVASVIIGVSSYITWITATMAPWRGRRAVSRLPLLIIPLFAWGGLWIILKTLASADVRNDLFYLVQYGMMGIAWVGVGIKLLPWVGFSLRDDIGEQDNRAAVPVIIGALIGLMACFAGANIGDGPGWWCVVWAGFLATVTWFIAVGVLASKGRLADTVTIERDGAAGFRLMGFMIAAGVICGRGAAGDWTSAFQTVIEFSAAWPLIPLILFALNAERDLRLTPEKPRSSWIISGIVVLSEFILVIIGLMLVGPMPDGYWLPHDGIER